MALNKTNSIKVIFSFDLFHLKTSLPLQKKRNYSNGPSACVDKHTVPALQVAYDLTAHETSTCINFESSLLILSYQAKVYVWGEHQRDTWLKYLIEM